MNHPVLLVDSSATVATKVRRAYASAGYPQPLLVARTLRRALQVLSKEPSPSLAIVDIAFAAPGLIRALGRDVPLVVWAARDRRPIPGPACLYKPNGAEECRLVLKMIRDYWMAAQPAVIHDSRKALAFLCSGRSRNPSSTWRSCSGPRRTF